MKEHDKDKLIDQELDDLLASLELEEPSINFTQRISLAAQNCPQKQIPQESNFLDSFIEDLAQILFSPRPALVAALCLMIGFAYGINDQSLYLNQTNNSTTMMDSYLFDSLEGELL